MGGRVVAVNLAVVRESISVKGTTGIDKRPVEHRVAVEPLGLVGDSIIDLDAHGGPNQAVYAYAREDAQWWSQHLDRELPPGCFGENLSTDGIAVTDALIGERWRIGTVVLQITRPRIPCRVFAAFWDVPDLIKQFTNRALPGAYLKVVQPGEVMVGDDIEVVHRPDHNVTIGVMFGALTTKSAWLPRLLTVPELDEPVREKVKRRLGQA